ncbi:3-hydroxyacyl-CoA dehydrogenase family protein [Fusobacterium varium]|jgi:3-hydroxybutyryl-CoA dehydrogenase|uniref:3-hydroxyacyl-CoA dehydrogenase family protein n=2 Tax=Fusobacterium varium TaxID=856 RepID=UPI000E3F8DDB|nr:3-hydroxyacyl-CoA dehydrogenase family protein [Fusobacterium varium]MCF0170946.1 3-hydroxyacyl-CoA dehydrogenase family protein [Fusobacterium varium]MCF2671884.1 3-hydroxyacyl-CoA dehydrogenase family protein [Fusobacterium varium]MDY4005256.1 3-hydroxyacyl-CoA dehydrogenase family protein [Fusobacterium varium]RGJ32064.1 3-hydroxyacyl-CoA dehydrogenase family protein [Fusobacterium varium]
MIKNISVIGAGTMGHGIAEVFAMHNYKVCLYEMNTEIRENVKKVIEDELLFLLDNDFIKKDDVQKTLENIEIFSDLKEAVKDADYVIEAIPERIELKQELFKQLDEYCKEETIFASNTSSLKLYEMSRDISENRKKRIMVCHWYNPAHLMPIAELSFFGNMPEEIYKEVEELYSNSEKQTVKILKDVPGLVANRIQQAIAREVFSLIEMKVAEPEDIDKALKFGPAFRYATSGQLEIADIGGLDIWCTVGDNLLSVMDNRKEANPLLRKKVLENKLGMKSGEGFFKYPKEKINDIKNKFNKKLIIQLKTSKSYIE